MGPLIFVASLLVFAIVWNPFETNEKGNNLANRMRLLSKKSVKLQQDNENNFYRSHIREWIETPFYQYVLDTIKKEAENGEFGVIINYLTEKNIILPTKTIYGSYGEAITPSGRTILFREIDYQFSPDELTHFSDTDALVTYIDGLIRYLKSEHFNVKIRPSYTNSITISW